eukprot:2489932-Pyramimonas_sp.AAC.1
MFPDALRKASKRLQSASGQPKRATRRPKEGLTESQSTQERRKEATGGSQEGPKNAPSRSVAILAQAA